MRESLFPRVSISIAIDSSWKLHLKIRSYCEDGEGRGGMRKQTRSLIFISSREVYKTMRVEEKKIRPAPTLPIPLFDAKTPHSIPYPTLAFEYIPFDKLINPQKETMKVKKVLRLAPLSMAFGRIFSDQNVRGWKNSRYSLVNA